MVTPALSILVLTEDSSPHAHETISALARRMLQLVDEDTATHRIRFQPTDARRAVHANRWQSKRPHPQLVDLKRDDVDAIIDDRLGRVRGIVPYYSIESWLYQSTTRLRELCQAGCGKHLDLIGQWEANRTLLDEVRKPKEQLCIGSTKNRDLAESITRGLSKKLRDARCSFHAAVEHLQSCPGLQANLGSHSRRCAELHESSTAIVAPSTASPAMLLPCDCLSCSSLHVV